MDSTSISLLDRLRRPGGQAAWERFVLLYTPLLCQWARRLGPRDQDEADLVQEVFALLVQKLPAFQYDAGQRFRGWRRTLASARIFRPELACRGSTSIPPPTSAELRHHGFTISCTAHRPWRR